DHRRVAEHPVQTAVVAPGALQVPADAPGVPGGGCQAGEPGQAGRRAEEAQVADGVGEELHAEQDADAGHALDHRGELVPVKPVLDELVQLADLPVEGDHLPASCAVSFSAGSMACWRA